MYTCVYMHMSVFVLVCTGVCIINLYIHYTVEVKSYVLRQVKWQCMFFVNSHNFYVFIVNWSECVFLRFLMRTASPPAFIYTARCFGTGKIKDRDISAGIYFQTSSSLNSWRSTDGALSAGASIISWRGGDSIIKSASGV